MEILLDIDICEGLLCDETWDVVSDDDRNELAKRTELDVIHDAQYVNIGPGADLIVLLLVADIGLRALKLGAEINDGIDGWIGVGKKLRKLFQRKKIVSIDIDGAASMAIELIAREVNIDLLEKLDETTINLVDVSGMIPINSGLSAKPHNYYILTYRVNGEDVYVVGVTSRGKAEIIKHFGFNPYGIRDIKLKKTL